MIEETTVKEIKEEITQLKGEIMTIIAGRNALATMVVLKTVLEMIKKSYVEEHGELGQVVVDVLNEDGENNDKTTHN